MFGLRIGHWLSVALVGSALLAAPAFADVAAPPPVPLVVDLDGILDHSKAGQAVTAQLTAHNKAFEKEHAAQEQRLAQVQRQLEQEQEHPTLSPEVFAQKANEFRREANQWRQDVQLNDRAVGLAAEGAREKLLGVMHDIIGAITLERHANLVLLESQVFFRADSYDISGEVLARLDEKMPTLKVTIPKVTDQDVSASPDGSDQGDSSQ